MAEILGNGAGKVLLREITEEDFEGYYSLVTDPNVYPYIIENGPLTKEETRKRIKRMKQTENTKYLAIEKKDTHEFIGYIGIFNTDNAMPAISYAILTREQRKGYCSKAIRCLINEFLFQYQEIIARTHCENIASQELLKKLGFEYLGIVDWNDEKRAEYVYRK